MQKQHSHRTFSETIRCFRLNGHFFRKNLMGWPSLSRYYKDTNLPQITCFIIVNISFFSFFTLHSLWLRDPIPVTKIIILRKLAWNSWAFLFYLKVNPPFLYSHYFSLDLMSAKTMDQRIPIIMKWRGCKLIPCSSK